MIMQYWHCSVAQSCLTLSDPIDCSMPGLSIPHLSPNLPKFMSIASVMPSSHLILWCPLLFLPSIFLSIRGFCNESVVHIRWPKYRSCSFSISPSNEYLRLISLKIDWFDLLAFPRDSQEPSSAPQFEGINSLALCLLYGPALTTVRDHWENHSIDNTNLATE